MEGSRDCIEDLFGYRCASEITEQEDYQSAKEQSHWYASLPFGGVKESGFGRELGDFGVREFVNVKTVRVAAHPADTTVSRI